MKIVVLIKEVPDTWGERHLDRETGRADRRASDPVIDEIDERALERALRHRDEHGGEVVVLAMAPAGATPTLRKALAIGADSAVHVSDPALDGTDSVRTARVLAAALRRIGFDLVLAGNESTDGRGGVVPAMIAELLELPQLTQLDSVEIVDGSVRGVRAADGVTMSVAATGPSIVSVTERNEEARFPKLKNVMSAKRKPLTVLTVAELGDEAGGRESTEVLSVERRPARAGGAKHLDAGDGGDRIAAFLADARLI